MDVLRGAVCVLLGYASFAAFLALERQFRLDQDEDPEPTSLVTQSEISAGSPDPLEPNPLLAVEGLTFLASSVANGRPGSCLAFVVGGSMLGACAVGTYAIDAWVGLFCFCVALGSTFPIGLAYSYRLWRRAGTEG